MQGKNSETGSTGTLLVIQNEKRAEKVRYLQQR
jgi:hypothetical protein